MEAIFMKKMINTNPMNCSSLRVLAYPILASATSVSTASWLLLNNFFIFIVVWSQS
jgi:hypothetical protein